MKFDEDLFKRPEIQEDVNENKPDDFDYGEYLEEAWEEKQCEFEKGLTLAQEHGLEAEYLHCVNELNMTPEQALKEWDIISKV